MEEEKKLKTKMMGWLWNGYRIPYLSKDMAIQRTFFRVSKVVC